MVVVLTVSVALRLKVKVPNCVGVPVKLTLGPGAPKLIPVGNVPLDVMMAFPVLPTAVNVWE
jgi:hypothetical protein